MKRKDLLKHLRNEGCEVLREGAKHTVFFHPETGKHSTIPRHIEVNDFLARNICRDLGVRPPSVK